MRAKKSRQANLERLRFPLLLLGLTFAGALILSFFEWRTFDEIEQISFDRVIENYLPDEQIIAAIPMRKPEAKKVQAQRPVVDVFQLVDDLKNIDIEWTVPELDDPDEPVIKEFDFKKEVVHEEPIFMIVEQMPEFPGGIEAMYGFIGKNIRYPEMAKDARKEGVVHLVFVVGKTGEIRDLRIEHGQGFGLDEEALRVISMMPNWNPGLQRGKPVNVQYRIPIKYTLY